MSVSGIVAYHPYRGRIAYRSVSSGMCGCVCARRSQSATAPVYFSEVLVEMVDLDLGPPPPAGSRGTLAGGRAQYHWARPAALARAKMLMDANQR